MFYVVDTGLGTLEVVHAPKTLETVFASLYDSRDGVRARGREVVLGLNSLTPGDIVRIDIKCRRYAAEKGDARCELHFSLVRIHWILGIPGVTMYRK